MSNLKIGDQARLIQPVIEGAVTDIRYNKDHECLEHLISYSDADGNDQQRWFLSKELEVANG